MNLRYFRSSIPLLGLLGVGHTCRYPARTERWTPQRNARLKCSCFICRRIGVTTRSASPAIDRCKREPRTGSPSRFDAFTENLRTTVDLRSARLCFVHGQTIVATVVRIHTFQLVGGTLPPVILRENGVLRRSRRPNGTTGNSRLEFRFRHVVYYADPLVQGTIGSKNPRHAKRRERRPAILETRPTTNRSV